MPREAFLSAARAFKSGVRTHPVMRNFSLSLSDDDIAALAAHFSRLNGATEDRTIMAPAVK